MGKKKRTPAPASGKSGIPDYYDLKTQAVEDLVTANEENSPPVSAAELRKYRSGPKIRLADWVKVLLLKVWTGGMICYFFIWGLSTFALNQWDHFTVLGLAFGLVTNLITNNILRFISGSPGAYDRWMMFPGKSVWFLPADIIYALLLVFCTVMTYNGINLMISGGESGAPAALAVEPILFGVIVTLWDLLFLSAKHLFGRILADAKRKAGGGI